MSVRICIIYRILIEHDMILHANDVDNMVGDQQMQFLLCYYSQSNYSLCVNLWQYGFSFHHTMVSVSLAQVCGTEEVMQCQCSVILTEK